MTDFPMHDTIANRYEIESRIGEGGMGTVYKAHDSLLEIDVAIKKLHKNDSADAAVRFQNEAVALGKLNHPNIARILDFANDTDNLYMVMEYLEGKCLSEVIGDERLELLEILEIFIDIADAMIHAHKNGVLHRDLKPSNIIIQLDDGKRIPKVVDFGIAKLQSRNQQITATGIGIGSPLYMSPEQARNDNVDERSDIYSFACMLYETISGKPPLRGKSSLETIQKQISETPLPLDEVMREYASYRLLVEFLSRALDKDQATRPQSFSQVKSELKNSLEEVLQLRAESGRLQEDSALESEERTVDSGSRSGRSKYILVAAVAIPLAVLGIGMLVFSQLGNETPEQGHVEKPSEEDLPQKASKLLDEVGGKIGLQNVPPKQDLSYNNTILKVEGPLADNALMPFQGNRWLKEVYASNCTSPKGSFPLRFFAGSKIDTFALNQCSFDDSQLSSLTKIPKLIRLRLQSLPEITDKGLNQLEKLQHLQVLSVCGCDKISDSGIAFAPKLGNLFSISLGGWSFTDEAFKYLIDCKSLKEISLNATRITPSALTAFIPKKPMTLLNVHNQDLDDNLIETIARSKISTVNIQDSEFTKSQLKTLSTSKHLTILCISATQLDNEDLRVLMGCPSLKDLRLSSMRGPVPDDFIDLVIKMPLSKLWFDNFEITNAQLQKFGRATSLESLTLTRTPNLTSADVDALRKRLGTRCTIVYVGKGTQQ